MTVESGVCFQHGGIEEVLKDRKEGYNRSGKGPGARKTKMAGCAGRNMQTRRDPAGQRRWCGK